MVLLLVACGNAEPLPEPDPDDVAPAPEPNSTTSAADAAVLSLERLQSATYYLPQYEDDPIRMRLGEFSDPAAERFATLVEAPILRDDLDGDGEIEAAVVVAVRERLELESNLVAMHVVGGRATQRAVIELGPGIVVTAMRRAGEELVLDILEIPGGAGSRPRSAQRTFVLDRAGWIQTSGEEE